MSSAAIIIMYYGACIVAYMPVWCDAWQT